MTRHTPNRYQRSVLPQGLHPAAIRGASYNKAYTKAYTQPLQKWMPTTMSVENSARRSMQEKTHHLRVLG